MEEKIYTKGKCYSRGNINAPIMVIAQAPGLDEISHCVEKENGDSILMPIPMCGPPGRLLHSMLSYLGMSEGDFILTNAVKYGTFQNKNYLRPPNAKELDESRRALFTEIVKVDPKLIIALGKEALWTLKYYKNIEYDELFIGKYQGIIDTISLDVLEYLDYVIPLKEPLMKEFKILPLYHPSAILRDTDGIKGYKKTTTEILNKNKDMFEKILNKIIR